MEHRIKVLENEKKYDEIISEAAKLSPEQCTSAEMAHAIGKAYEKKNAFSQCLPWYIRAYELNPYDETLGMAIGVCLAAGKYDELRELLETKAVDKEGYYYTAGMYELSLRTNAGTDSEIEKLELFLDIQDEESYMLRLATLYLMCNREKEAQKLCRKLSRLFISGQAVEYANVLYDEIKSGNGSAYVKSNPWTKNQVFQHASFDVNAPLKEDVQIAAVKKEAAPKKVPEAVTKLVEETPQVVLPELGKKQNKPKQETTESEDVPEKKGGLSAMIGRINEQFASMKKEEAKDEKKEKKDKISPVVEKCLADVIGMQELRVSMNSIFNIMQTMKKRSGFKAVFKDNLQILGPDGSGKTTAAMAAANALCEMGIISEGIPAVTDYFSLVGNSVEETHDNIEALFQCAGTGCILIENIHEFDVNNGSTMGLDAIDQLVKAYMAAEGKIPFIITGSEAEVEALLQKKKRFGELFDLPAIILGKYTAEELVLIAHKIAEGKGLIIDDDADAVLRDRLGRLVQLPTFKYARDLSDMINDAYRQQVNRIMKLRRPSANDYHVIKAEDFGSSDAEETVEELLEKLNSLIGLSEVKEQVNKIVNQVTIQKQRKESGITAGQGRTSLHLVFKGNAGTGKTTVARLIGKIYKRLGVLPSGHLVECGRNDLVAGYIGHTAPKVKAKVQEAMGGILFIDEAYALAKGGENDFGKEAIDTLVADIENYRDNLMVIIAGYSADMDNFLSQNQGLSSRFSTEIMFEDYSTEEMVQIFKKNVKDAGFLLDAGLDEDIELLLDSRKKKKDFGNARGVRNVFEEVCLNLNNRLAEQPPKSLSKNDYMIIKKEDLQVADLEGTAAKGLNDYIDELNALTGLASVKSAVNTLISKVQVNQTMKEAGLKTKGFGTLHMVFKGNAGTGKTTVARLIGNIYRELGILPIGHLVECGRNDLVAGYIGQTAPKVKAKVQEAMGGILFIDEAYALAKGGENDFGKEAIDTLVADIENYRDSLMVIIAGYSDDMDDFLNQNQGLRSRFPNEILFEDYTVDEMRTIFKSMVRGNGLLISDELDAQIDSLIAEHSSGADFGNARGIRNLVDGIDSRRSVRLAKLLRSGAEPSLEALRTVVAEDLGAAAKAAEKEKEKKKSVEELLAELNALTGLAAVKEKVNKLVAGVKVNQKMKEAGLAAQKFGTLHMVFKGNAGTGKTTVARLIGSIYKELGVLSSGHLVECGRSDLVASYIGQTAPKVKAKIQEAMGGILFIDEAYTLAKGSENDFGKEAIDTLVADIENFRDDLMVIIAGYSEDMDMFLRQNQGLESRFPNEIFFEDYSPEELKTIFKSMAKGKGLRLEEGLDADIDRLIAAHATERNFGNARGVRNLLDAVCEQRNMRIAKLYDSGMEPTKEQLQALTAEDLQ